MDLDDLKKTVEAAVGALTPGRARKLATSLLEPGAAKDQVAKATADILEWSQRSRERVGDLVRREVRAQMQSLGLATQQEMDAVKKRVRQLERAAGGTSSRKKTAAKTTATKRSTATRRSASGSPNRPGSG